MYTRINFHPALSSISQSAHPRGVWALHILRRQPEATGEQSLHGNWMHRPNSKWFQPQNWTWQAEKRQCRMVWATPSWKENIQYLFLCPLPVVFLKKCGKFCHFWQRSKFIHIHPMYFFLNHHAFKFFKIFTLIFFLKALILVYHILKQLPLPTLS